DTWWQTETGMILITPLPGVTTTRPGSTYTFGLILAVALAGIGFGAALYGRSRGKRPATLMALAATTTLEAVFVALPYALGDRIALFAIFSRSFGALGFWGYLFGWTEIACLVVLPASIIAGIQFPQLVALLGRGRKSVGEDVGLTYAWNTLGAIGGSLAGGFGLVPLLSATGAWKAVVILLAALSAWTLVLAIRSQKSWRRGALPLTGIAASLLMIGFAGPTAVWRHTPIGAGRVQFTDASPNLIEAWQRDQRRGLAWDADGRESSVALVKTRGGVAFSVNGKVDGNSREDAATQVMGGLVGAALHPDMRRALVIGLGTGSTAGWLGSIPAIERVDVIELESAVLDVARDCATVNRNVLANPKVKITIGDARELLLTTRERYDVIFSEPSNPYRAGISSLFTREFYDAVRSRLSKDGIFIQWLQAYEVNAQTVRTIYATLGSAFPSVETFSGKKDDMLLVATVRPLRYPTETLRRRLSEEPYASAMNDAWRVTGLEGFLSHYVARDSLARAIVREEKGRINLDDRNLVEFAFARSLGSSLFQSDDLRALSEQRGENRPVLEGSDPDWVAVSWHKISALTEEGITTPVAGATEGDIRRLTAHSAFLAGNLGSVRGAWLAGPWQPVGPLEVTMIGEAMADGGDASTLAWVEQVRQFQPAEAGAILARYLWSQGKYAECYAATAAAFRRYREDPWPTTSVMDRLLAIATDLPSKNAELARPVYELLTPPFAVAELEEGRLLTRLAVARYLGSSHVAEALGELEPNFPWREELLEERARIYTEVGDRRAEQARRELEAFRSHAASPLSKGLEPK
ncbi:MAG: fused MFS/spermidine synthase, partial [Acidobacteriota bacterium]